MKTMLETSHVQPQQQLVYSPVRRLVVPMCHTMPVYAPAPSLGSSHGFNTPSQYSLPQHSTINQPERATMSEFNVTPLKMRFRNTNKSKFAFDE